MGGAAPGRIARARVALTDRSCTEHAAPARAGTLGHLPLLPGSLRLRTHLYEYFVLLLGVKQSLLPSRASPSLLLSPHTPSRLGIHIYQ